MRIRKAERERLEALLSEPSDLDELVGQVFDTVADAVVGRDWYTVAVKWDRNVLLYGPYESTAVAERAMKEFVSPGPGPMTFQVYKLYKVGE